MELDSQKKKQLKPLLKRAEFEVNPSSALHNEAVEQTDLLEEIKNTLKSEEKQKVTLELPDGVHIATLKGERGESGKDGKDADEEMIIKAVLAQIPVPKDGEDADEQRIIEAVINQIPTPENGKDADPVDIDSVVKQVMSRIKLPKDGEPGKDGVNPDPKEVIDLIKKLPEKEKFGIEDLRNSTELRSLVGKMKAYDSDGFRFGGKKYKFEELMHGSGNGGSSITLKTNSVNNGSQSILNLKQGSNITLIDDGVGGVTIASTGGGTPGGLNLQVQYNNGGVFGGISGAVTNGTILNLTNPLIGGGTLTTSTVNGVTLTTAGSATTFLNGAGNYTTPAGTVYTGTTNRITVTGTVIDIAATYTGQTSITTLGTIGTGMWQGSTINYAYLGSGGTGAGTKYLADDNTWKTYAAGGGTVSSVASADGSITVTNPTSTVDLAVVKAPIWSTARLLAGNSVNGSANVPFANKFIVQGTTDTGLTGAQFLGALGTGIVKNTTTTGVLSIAVAGTDYESPLTFSTGLTRATNTITADLSTGISGGQSAIGGTASGNNLTLSSTSNATKGKIFFGTASVYDEVNMRLGINRTSPTTPLDVTGTSIASIGTDFGTNAPNVMRLVGVAGGFTSSSGAFVQAGSGSGVSIQGGIGGNTTGSPTTGSGGKGGSLLFMAGGGGLGTTFAGGGGDISLIGGGAGFGGSSIGGYVGLSGGDSAVFGNSSGGSVYIIGGAKSGTGVVGDIYLGTATDGFTERSRILASSLKTGSTAPTTTGTTQMVISDSNGLLSFTTIPSGSVTPRAETPSGTINSSNVTFTLANTPLGNLAVIVILDGLIQRNGVGLDYTVSGTTITFTTAPITGSEIFAYYNS